MRKLASIQQVKEIIPIEGADMIEIAKVNGWQCVVKKGEFKAGDLGVYFEIDSFLPASDERFSFLERQFKTFEDTLGARIRTIKLRGEISQGLILSLSAFPEITSTEIDDDVTDILNIKKYEKPMPMHSEAKGNFPSFIEKTDQERVQNLKRFDKSGLWERSEKLDGSSLTIYLNKMLDLEGKEETVFGVCSRNLDLLETEDNPMWKIAKDFNLKERLESFGKNIALQGEIIGGKIQGNRYKVPSYEYHIYDIYDIDNKKKFLPEERKEALKVLNEGYDDKIKEVPVLGYVELPEDDDWMDVLLKEADGKSVLNKDTIREGDVYKHKEKNLSFKVISNKYLLKYDE